MVSKSIAIGAIGVAIVVVVAGWVFIDAPHPRLTPAEQMILRATDMPGQNWSEIGGMFSTSHTWTSDDAHVRFHRDPFGPDVMILLYAFNTRSDAINEYQTMIASTPSNGTEEVQIGDGGVLFEQNGSLPTLLFHRDRVLVWMDLQSFAEHPLSVNQIHNMAIGIGSAQAEKIGRYIGE
jgi:hypothetical protein